MKQVLLLTIVLGICQMIQAQNPFEEFGYKGKILTATNGRFNEFHDLDSVVQIGSILLDVQKLTIVGDAPIDTLTYMPSPTVISRWLSPDKMSEKYYHLSPYSFVDNNPIHNEDPDGNIIIYGKYKQEAKAALRYLAKNSPSARRDINRLRWSFKVTKISGSISDGAKSEYNPREISFKPFKGSTNSNGDVQSPAVFLSHEVHHSAESLRDKSLTDPNSAANQQVDPNTGNKIVEEQTVQHEGRVVDELNANVNDGSPEGKRENYSDNGQEVKVDSPTSNTPVDKYSEKTRARIRKEETKKKDN